MVPENFTAGTVTPAATASPEGARVFFIIPADPTVSSAPITITVE